MGFSISYDVQLYDPEAELGPRNEINECSHEKRLAKYTHHLRKDGLKMLGAIDRYNRDNPEIALT